MDGDRRMLVSTQRFQWRNCTECDSKMNEKTNQTNENCNQILLAKIVEKSESIKLARKFMLRIIEKKSALEKELRGKNEETGKLNDKLSLVTLELKSTKSDLEKALAEIKPVKDAVHNSAISGNEKIEKKNIMHSRKQLELAKADELLDPKRRKNKVLEANPPEWRSMKYADPHYWDILQTKNRLQKELPEKLAGSQSEDDEFQQTGWTKMKKLLERKPANLIDDPERHITDYCKTMHDKDQREKIKRVSALVKKHGHHIKAR